MHNPKVAGMTMDLWASGVGGVAGSKRLGVRGLWACGGVGTAAGLGLEFGKSQQAH